MAFVDLSEEQPDAIDNGTRQPVQTIKFGMTLVEPSRIFIWPTTPFIEGYRTPSSVTVEDRRKRTRLVTQSEFHHRDPPILPQPTTNVEHVNAGIICGQITTVMTQSYLDRGGYTGLFTLVNGSPVKITVVYDQKSDDALAPVPKMITLDVNDHLQVPFLPTNTLRMSVGEIGRDLGNVYFDPRRSRLTMNLSRPTYETVTNTGASTSFKTEREEQHHTSRYLSFNFRIFGTETRILYLSSTHLCMK